MFHAVRRWWRGGRGKHVAQLFAFEFVVVVAGVLVAQGLANWVADRSTLRRLGSTRALLDQDIQSTHESALIWQRAAPCLSERVERIMRRSARSEPLTAADLERPGFLSSVVRDLSDESEAMFRARYGDAVTDHYLTLSETSRQLDALAQKIADRWVSLKLLDRADGSPDVQERFAARTAGLEIREDLATLVRKVPVIISESKALGVAPRPIPAFDGRRVPVANCADMWEQQSISRTVDR